MLFNTSRTLLSRAALRTIRTIPASVSVRIPAFKLPSQLQVRHASSGTREYTVRDALNEALGMYLFCVC